LLLNIEGRPCDAYKPFRKYPPAYNGEKLARVAGELSHSPNGKSEIVNNIFINITEDVLSVLDLDDNTFSISLLI
jgi:hypothetical protein